MFNALLLASLPVLLCQATYLDPSLLQQKPLMHGIPSDILSDVTILPLTVRLLLPPKEHILSSISRLTLRTS